MKKIIIVPVGMLLLATASRAQLSVNCGQKVGIGTETELFQPILMVGDNSYFDESNNYNIGIGASPDVMNNNNIGIYARTHSNSVYYFQLNCGALGIIEATNSQHGSNYGLCGMINPPANSTYYGGAGIYATNYDYYYSSPTNIQGAYAAYFVGNVVSTGNLTVNSMYTICDPQLSDNIVSLSGTRESGTSTLENLLGMDVIEYNLKPRLKEEIPEDVTPEKAEELRKELEYLKQEEQKMTARRHFGIDARDLQQVYPDLVLEGEDGSLSVNYLEMVPLVIRSIQELKQQIDEVKDADSDSME